MMLLQTIGFESTVLQNAGSFISKMFMLIFAVVIRHTIKDNHDSPIPLRYFLIILIVPASSIYIMHNIFLIANAHTESRMEEETTALTQLSALMQAAVEAPEGALQVLFPMIPDVDAWRTRMDQMKRRNESLKEKGLPFCGNLPVGCLIEIPAAALMAGEIIDAGADFLAVDLDDLVQYTCGVSRREKPTPADNPAVLRLVQDMMHAAQTRGVLLEQSMEYSMEKTWNTP